MPHLSVLASLQTGFYSSPVLLFIFLFITRPPILVFFSCMSMFHALEMQEQREAVDAAALIAKRWEEHSLWVFC